MRMRILRPIHKITRLCYNTAHFERDDYLHTTVRQWVVLLIEWQELICDRFIADSLQPTVVTRWSRQPSPKCNNYQIMNDY